MGFVVTEVKLWDAKKYHANSRIQEWISQQLLKDLKARFAATTPPHSTFLDIGCGSGHVTASVLDVFKGINIVGIDLSSNMIDYAQRHWKSPHLRKLWEIHSSILFANFFGKLVFSNSLTYSKLAAFSKNFACQKFAKNPQQSNFPELP